jgi:hypothetical protein
MVKLKRKLAGGMTQVVKHLPSKHKTNPGTAKKKKKNRISYKSNSFIFVFETGSGCVA